MRFVFDPDLRDREFALIISMMPVFSKRYYETHDFSKTTLDPPLGNGPYSVAEVDPGRSLTFKRNPDYWGKDLSVNRGFSNFDEIRYDYYRDANAAFEAFKAGSIDLRREPDSNVLRWSRGYNFPAVRKGQVLREEFWPPQYIGMLGLAINTRREKFRDVRVREALVRAFDFEWLNTNYFFDGYSRSKSFFLASDLAAEGPATPAEQALLAPYKADILPEIMDQGLQFTSGDTYHHRIRRKLTRATTLFRDAGYEVRGGRMVHTQTGKPFRFEIMIEHPIIVALRWTMRIILKRSVLMSVYVWSIRASSRPGSARMIST